jgi:hypothetical protein
MRVLAVPRSIAMSFEIAPKREKLMGVEYRSVGAFKALQFDRLRRCPIRRVSPYATDFLIVLA